MTVTNILKRVLPTGKSPDLDSAFVEGTHAGLLS